MSISINKSQPTEIEQIAVILSRLDKKRLSALLLALKLSAEPQVNDDNLGVLQSKLDVSLAHLPGTAHTCIERLREYGADACISNGGKVGRAR